MQDDIRAVATLGPEQSKAPCDCSECQTTRAIKADPAYRPTDEVFVGLDWKGHLKGNSSGVSVVVKAGLRIQLASAPVTSESDNTDGLAAEVLMAEDTRLAGMSARAMAFAAGVVGAMENNNGPLPKDIAFRNLKVFRSRFPLQAAPNVH